MRSALIGKGELAGRVSMLQLFKDRIHSTPVKLAGVTWTRCPLGSIPGWRQTFRSSVGRGFNKTVLTTLKIANRANPHQCDNNNCRERRMLDQTPDAIANV